MSLYNGKDVFTGATKQFRKETNKRLMAYYKTDNGKLILGDVINKEIINENSIDLIVTSPPYNLNIEYEKHNDNMIYDDYMLWVGNWLSNCFHWLKDSGRICINIPMKITMPSNKKVNIPLEADYIKLAQSIGFQYNNTIIWNKGNIVKTCWGSFKSASSPFIRDNIEAIIILYKDQWKKKHKGNSDIDNKEFVKWTQTLWNFNGQNKKQVGNHPAPFPEELPLRCIKCFSYINDTILDPFVGSGTTGKVCEQYDRKWIGIDNGKTYLDFAKKRIHDYIKKTKALNTFFKQGE